MSGVFTFVAPPPAEKVNEENKDGEEGEDGGEGGDPTEHESTAQFTPIVELKAVETKNFEEDEIIVYKERAKLFVFDETLLNKGTGNKTWNERGVGEMKLLKHKDTSRIRLLMRMDKTLKIIINHHVDHQINLTEMPSTDRAWMWATPHDFSEPEEGLQAKTFAARFKTPEVAKEFQKAFTSAVENNRKIALGEDSKEGAKEADEAAKALDSLSVGTKEEGEKKKEEGEDKDKTTA